MKLKPISKQWDWKLRYINEWELTENEGSKIYDIIIAGFVVLGMKVPKYSPRHKF